ncbi:MAG: EAL domain-containing protein [Minwuia sp.]|nr:EAL domain-containing protein [Minwuia sp.]
MPHRSDAHHAVWLSGEFIAAEGRGELSIAYQPIVELATSRVVGAEALLRWTHATRGAVAPNTFIGFAEPEGLLSGPGAFALQTALDDLASWRETSSAARGLFVSVNVSPTQLDSPGLVADLKQAIDDRGMALEDLHLELTETAPPPGPGAARALQALHSHGFHISIDDFGTGYSSLLRVQNLPCDSLKIDRAFTAGLPDDTACKAIVASSLALAHGMSMGTVAEGIETVAQRDHLHDAGCDLGQGYLFGKPVDAATFMAAHLD